MDRIKSFIGAEYRSSSDPFLLPVFEPGKGTEYALLEEADSLLVSEAVRVAEEAFPIWSGFSPAKRAECLRKLGDLIMARIDALAEMESKDNGKPLSLARKVDIPRAASNFHFFASAIEQFNTEAHITDNETLNYTRREPIGVVACISPWNLPLYLFTWKIAPALACGNTVVAKPSEITPVTASLLGAMAIEAGFPSGVLTILQGRGSVTGASMVEHSGVKAISFTGGTATGRHIAGLAAGSFKKISLELGGKNPHLIFDDVSLDEVVASALRSSFTNQGQICLCGSRILVQESLYDAFLERFCREVKALRVGPPESEGVFMGALVSREHLEKVHSYVELAREEGGTVLCGGHAIHLPEPHAKGYYYAPTVITGLPMSCRTNQEEIFGPVVTVQSFQDEDQAVRLANDSSYGLAGQVWTRDVDRAHRVSAKLQCGIVWVNCWMVRDLRTPFGGMRSSGVGREGGMEALRFFTEAKNVCVRFKPL